MLSRGGGGTWTPLLEFYMPSSCPFSFSFPARHSTPHPPASLLRCCFPSLLLSAPHFSALCLSRSSAIVLRAFHERLSLFSVPLLSRPTPFVRDFALSSPFSCISSLSLSRLHAAQVWNIHTRDVQVLEVRVTSSWLLAHRGSGVHKSQAYVRLVCTCSSAFDSTILESTSGYANATLLFEDTSLDKCVP